MRSPGPRATPSVKKPDGGAPPAARAHVQPGQTVTASSGGHPESWPADGSGYAAVYLHGPCAGR